MTVETNKTAAPETARPKKHTKKQTLLNVLMYGWIFIVILIVAIVIGVMSLFD